MDGDSSCRTLRPFSNVWKLTASGSPQTGAGEKSTGAAEEQRQGERASVDASQQAATWSRNVVPTG